MNRKEKREKKRELNILKDLVTIIEQYFPELIDKFEGLTDLRNQTYVKYKKKVIFMVRLLGLMCEMKSMKGKRAKYKGKYRKYSTNMWFRIRRDPTLWYNKWCIWKSKSRRNRRNKKIYDK